VNELERIWPDPDRRENALDWLLVRIWTGRTPLHPRRDRPSIDEARWATVNALHRIRRYSR
jgi:hypothetical protein